jgi:hypothetical protein
MSIDHGGPKRHALGIDFGTSNTVAVGRWPDGRARPILVDGSPLLPSAVYAEPDGQLAAGRDAVYSARLDPARFEPNPKRRVDDGLVLLGDREIPVVELIAAVLERVAEEWRRTVGPVPTDVTLTCPATWGATRRSLLADAAARAGLGGIAPGTRSGPDPVRPALGRSAAGPETGGPRLVAEPVAAATYFAEVLGRDVPIGSVVVVHDFGAGTFDASVVARTAEGFEVMAVDGRDDIGGLDIDAAVVEHLQTQHTDAAWQRITEPATVEERRAQRQLWDDVRVAKERLSRSQSADLVVPLLDLEIHLTRDELETLARPVLDQTVQITRRLLRWADLPEGRLAGVFLVGGASRIPLVATLLHRELGEAPVVIEQPELVVAEGSILADAALLAAGPAAPGPTAELRLIFARRNESETVVAARLPGHPGAAGAGMAAGSSGGRDSTAGTSFPVPSSAAQPQPSTTRPAGATAVVPSSDGVAHPSAGSGISSTAVLPDGPGSASADAPQSEPGAPRADGSELPPAVDPWPHAVPERWTPDPDQTVADEPTWRPDTPSWDPASSAPTSPATGSVRSGPQSGSSRSGSITGSARPISPDRPDRMAPSTASATRPLSPARPTVPNPRREPRDAARQSSRGAQARPPGAEPRPAGTRPAARPPAARPPARSRPRRRGRFLRSLQIMLSVIVLITVPVAAMILAYSYGTGEPFQDAAIQLAHDLKDLYDRHLA